MAELSNDKSTARRQLSRLQKRAPASIQISPATDWKVAIPLLSPLVQSPSEEIRSNAEIIKDANAATLTAATEKQPVVVMAKWQHPAAPFCYEPAPFLPFLCTGNLER